jgi:hypothetical protein
MLRIARRSVYGLVLMPFSAAPFSAAWARIYSESGVAMRGTDVVAYFTEGRPVRGSAAHQLDWRGAKWRFASAAHRDRFAADPEACAPAFGGFCAWAVSRGYTASTDPQAWRIVEGRLYLNYSLAIRRQWSEDIPGNIALGNANWPRLRDG